MLALVAVGLSGYLGAISLQHAQALGCNFASFDCDAVLATQWSKVLGMPVAFLGAGCYLGIFLASWLAGASDSQTSRWGVGLMTLLTASALVAGVWFTALQFGKLGTLCVWCLGVHACGLLAALVLVSAIWIARHRAPRRIHNIQSALVPQVGGRARTGGAGAVPSFVQLLLPVFLGMLGAGAMIGGQLLLPEASHEIAQADELAGDFDFTSPAENVAPAAELDSADDASIEQSHLVRRPTSDIPKVSVFDELEGDSDEWLEDNETTTSETEDSEAGVPLTDLLEPKEKPSRMVEFLNGRLKIDLYNQAYIGPPEAPHVLIELFDYTCEHCRKMNANLRRLDRRYGKQIVIVAMPVPLEKRCNPNVPKARPENRGSCNLTTLALCIATIEPGKFGRFHDWLLKDEDRSRRYETALLLGYKRFGREKVRENIHSPEFGIRVRQHINLFSNLKSSWREEKKFGLPVLIAGDKISSGTFDSKSELYEFLETGLDMAPGR